MNAPFDNFKRETLKNIESGVDFSPKGSIDVPILDLVTLINSHPNYVTTSTCSGRISVFYQSNASKLLVENKGVNWIVVNHGIISKKEVHAALAEISQAESDSHESFVYLKAEPLIFHIACRDIESARTLQSLVLQAGYRESGVTLGQKKTMLAIRTTAFLFETIIAKGGNLLISEDLLDIYIAQCNNRLQSNFERMENLLRAIKKDWNFPSFSISKINDKVSGYDSHKIRDLSSRWGHAAVYSTLESSSSSTSASKSTVTSIKVFGGYGLDSAGSTSRRGIANLALDLKDNLDSFSHSETQLDAMHFCCVSDILCSNLGYDDLKFMIYSGGRKGPQCPLPATFEVLMSRSDNKYEAISYREVGDVPALRWGHTLTSFNKNKSVLLFGGRNESVIFDDIYSLDISMETSENLSSSGCHSEKLTAVLSWKRLDLKRLGNSTDAALLPLFFHAACEVSVNRLNDNRDINKREYSVILIAGGLCSLDQMNENTTVYAIVPEIGVYYDVACSHKFTGDTVIESSSIISRFGHTLNNINNGKTIVLIGGCSLRNSDFNKTNGNVVVMDYYMNYSKLYSSNVDSYGDIGFIELYFRAPSYINSDGLTLDCQDCRCHHQTIVRSDGMNSSILIVGGGVQALGFGAHYCPLTLMNVGSETSLLVLISKEKQSNSTSKSATKVGGSNNTTTNVISNSTTNLISKYYVVLSLKSNAKLLKSKLEEIKVYDKSKKIAIFDKSQGEILRFVNASVDTETLGDLMAIPVLDGGFDELVKNVESNWLQERCVAFACQHVDNKGNSTKSDNSKSESTSNTVSVEANLEKKISQLAKSENDVVKFPIVLSLKSNAKLLKSKLEEIKVYDKTKRIFLFDKSQGEILRFVNASVDTETLGDLMAIPVLDGGFDELVKNVESNWLQERCVAFAYQIGSKNPAFLSKSLVHNNYRKAEEYLERVRDLCNIPIEGRECYPTKYELVGNVLMLTDDCLIGAHWEWLVNPNFTEKFRGISTLEFWKGLADCFNAIRVARKSRIDPGPLRESRVQLIYYPGIENDKLEDLPNNRSDTGSNSNSKSWVVVTENGIHYGFDLIRVMFCSGNVTERMRMGKVNMCKDEVIVDFYAGIGYYTIPFLYYGNAKFVHACDHNPNSCYSLQHNLNRMKIAASRYKIYLNDNKITSLQLVNLADRICLGLLPSSEDGWPLAVRALKTTGGFIHVHENVHEDNLESWTVYCVKKFEKYFLDAGKPMRINCTWVEKVKSYSPRVWHVVADLTCVPI